MADSTDTEKVISNKELLMEKLRKKYPEESFDDEEATWGRISADYDQYDQELAGYKEREGKFADMFTSDPRSARLMMEWRNGGDPAVTLIRLYGEDVKDAIDDPEKQEAIAEANKEYMERVSKEKEYEAEYTENLGESLRELERVQQERGLSDEQIDAAMEWIVTIAKDAMLGRFSPETIDMALKAQTYDNDVARASVEGEVRGKNSKVTEKLRRPKSGDGTVRLGGGNSRGGHGDGLPDLGAMNRFNDSMMSIYERGGEKRRPVRN